VDDRWEVWVGRNNKENDELTHRASHSKDIWLHAQGVPGSHVILRTAGKPEQVPRTVLEKAAALAAQNSRARHSELVPVIFTEKRYVRKPRKALPGTAVCLREKSLFVAPGLAPGVVSI
jgi:predicted ribosome quality control (RQC) complex YloA/Tae2 family protein